MTNLVAAFTAVADSVPECRQTEVGGAGAVPVIKQR